MNYAYHNIKHIVQPYLGDLPAHSKHCEDHPLHLRDIFLCCRHYNIRLNLHKCMFCVQPDRILGFVLLKQGIYIDALKVQTVLDLHAPSSFVQLQCLQGKANFLRRFSLNYAKLMKGFTLLLKKGVPLHWDDTTQKGF